MYVFFKLIFFFVLHGQFDVFSNLKKKLFMFFIRFFIFIDLFYYFYLFILLFLFIYFIIFICFLVVARDIGLMCFRAHVRGEMGNRRAETVC